MNDMFQDQEEPVTGSSLFQNKKENKIMKRELYVSEEFKKKFVSEIKRVLRVTGITINSYASELGVSRQTVSKMLNDNNYNIKIVYAVASMEVLWEMIGKTRMPFNSRSYARNILIKLINEYWHREQADTSKCFIAWNQ